MPYQSHRLLELIENLIEEEAELLQIDLGGLELATYAVKEWSTIYDAFQLKFSELQGHQGWSPTEIEKNFLEKIEGAKDLFYGMCLWPAGIGLTKYLKKSEFNFSGKNTQVIELGAGIGLGSIFLSLEPNLSCLVTDNDPSLELLLRKNRKNLEENLQKKLNIGFELLDWSKPIPDKYKKSFDLVIASDVLYHMESTGKFVNLLENLGKESFRVIIADPIRFDSLSKIKQLKVRFSSLKVEKVEVEPGLCVQVLDWQMDGL